MPTPYMSGNGECLRIMRRMVALTQPGSGETRSDFRGLENSCFQADSLDVQAWPWSVAVGSSAPARAFVVDSMDQEPDWGEALAQGPMARIRNPCHHASA